MVDCAGLENRRSARIRGFESHLLRQSRKLKSIAVCPCEFKLASPFDLLLSERPTVGDARRGRCHIFSMHKCSLILLASFIAGLALVHPLHAGPSTMDPKAAPLTDDMGTAFLCGKLDLQISLGAEESIQYTSPGRPNIDYGLAVARLGYMLDDARGPGWRRGNDEVMVEAIAGPIYTGPGTFLTGLSLIYRRNFVPPNARFIPYIDLGAGGIYSDAYHQKSQRALGSAFEFDLQAGVGLRYRLNPRWSMDTEVSFRHLSNADFSSRNYGTNALGGLVGVGYAF